MSGKQIFGYFKGDLDDIPEPLLILPNNLLRDDSIIGVDATTKDNIQTNATKQELLNNNNNKN